MHPSFIASLVLALAILPRIAAAAPEGANAPEGGRGVDVIAHSDVGMLLSAGGHQASMLDAGLAAFYRPTRRLAFGMTASRSWSSYESTAILVIDGRFRATEAPTIYRGALAIRYDYAILGPATAWVAGDLGVAFARDRYTATDPDFHTRTTTDTRVAPWMGASTGLELRPVRVVSIGLRVGAAHLAFSAPAESGSAIPGPVQSLYAGLALGVHLPID